MRPRRVAADDGFCAAADAKFSEYGVNVEFDSVLADIEALGNGLVRQPLGQESQHLVLARGQTFQEGCLFLLQPGHRHLGRLWLR